MHEGIEELLRRFEAESIDSVSLLKEGIAFMLSEGGSLTCIRLPSLRRGGVVLPIRSAEWFEALWACVGLTPSSTSVRDGKLTFELGDLHVEIDFGAPDHFDPESVILQLKDGWEVF